jgi:tetratricopeptide (TPR) repeat protein
MVLSAGVGGAAAFGLGSASWWIVLPLFGATVPLWPRLTRALASKAATTASLSVDEVAMKRLPTVARWAMLVLAVGACVGAMLVAAMAGTTTLPHLLAIVSTFALAIGVWAWQFAKPKSFGRRIATCAIGWSVGLSGNWVASATDCSNNNLSPLIAAVHGAAFRGAREGGREGAKEGVKEALNDPVIQDAFAERIADRIIKAAPGPVSDGLRIDPEVFNKLIVRAVLRAKAAADTGDAQAGAALAEAESAGRPEQLLVFLDREAQKPLPDEELVEMHREIAGVAEVAGDSRAALAAYDEVLRRRPNDIDALTRSGELLLNASGDISRASDRFIRARDVASTAGDQFWAMIGLGDVAIKLHGARAAVIEYKRAQELARRLRERNGSDPVVARNFIVATIRLGDALSRQGEHAAAVNEFHLAVERLTDPKSPLMNTIVWLKDLGYVYDRIGSSLLTMGNVAGAEAAFETALEHLRSASLQAPIDRSITRAVTLGRVHLADVLLAKGDVVMSTLHYEEAHEEARALALVDPDNTEWQRDLSLSYDQVGGAWVACGQLEKARASYTAGMAIRVRLFAHNPENTEWQRDLSISHEKIGDVQAAQADVPGAMASYAAAMEIRTRLASRDPENTEWQRDLSISNDRLGGMRVSQGDLPRALASFTASMEIRKRLVSRDPENTLWKRDLSISHVKIGDVMRRTGDISGAKQSFESAFGIAQELVMRNPANDLWQRDLGMAHMQLVAVHLISGDVAAAREHLNAGRGIVSRLVEKDSTNALWREDLDAFESILRLLDN